MIVAWRLAREPHATQQAAFSGEGARRFGGRWNSPGVAVTYLSDSLALAALESLVHADRGALARPYLAFRVELEERDVLRLLDDDLPADWRSRPVSSGARALGDGWARRAASLALSVPSALVTQERNLVLNPAHPRAAALRVAEAVPFAFDPRFAAAPRSGAPS